MSGSIIKSIDLPLSSIQIAISSDEFHSGMYFAKMSNKNGQCVKKIVLTK